MTRDEILAAAKLMTPAQRYDLIEDLRQILDDDDALSPQQIAEIKRRVEASDRGEGTSISVEESVAALREKLRNKRRRAS